MTRIYIISLIFREYSAYISSNLRGRRVQCGHERISLGWQTYFNFHETVLLHSAVSVYYETN